MGVRLASLILLALAAACDIESPTANLPRVVSPLKPNTLATEAVPETLDQALDALDRGLSGGQFLAMQRLDEGDAVVSLLYDVGSRIRKPWALDGDGPLPRQLFREGVRDPDDMPSVILTSYWRRLHGRPIDLADQARPVEPAVRFASHGVVMSEHSALTLVHMCDGASRASPDAAWLPDAAMIRHLDEVLRPALQVALDRGMPARLPRLKADNYYRQYGGLFLGGKKIIFVNGFYQRSLAGAAFPDSWRVAAENVCDGGWLVFGAEYDPDSRELHALRFHGNK